MPRLKKSHLGKDFFKVNNKLVYSINQINGNYVDSYKKSSKKSQ